MTHSFRLSIYLDFTDSIDFYRKIHVFFCSSKNENWFQGNIEFVDNWVAIESRRIKQFTITFLDKGFKKNHIFPLKPALKSSSDGRYWPGFLFFPVFHDLDLPPFQNNLSSACSYFPE